MRDPLLPILNACRRGQELLERIDVAGADRHLHAISQRRKKAVAVPPRGQLPKRGFPTLLPSGGSSIACLPARTSVKAGAPHTAKARDRCLPARVPRKKVKERRIGFEVFERDADYDTSRDSIVRTTAADVSKCLAQYYPEP
jgi:hypothetical protein